MTITLSQLLASGAVLCVILAFSGWVQGRGFLSELIGLWILLIPIFGVASCAQSEDYQASVAASARQATLDAKPHLLDTVDGCKRYGWRTGDIWHYALSCPGTQTTTDTGHKESYQCGKSTCSRTVYESISSGD